MLCAEIVEVAFRNFQTVSNLRQCVVGQVVHVTIERDLLVAVDLNLRDLRGYDEILFAFALALDFGCEFDDAFCCFHDFSLVMQINSYKTLTARRPFRRYRLVRVLIESGKVLTE